MRLGDKLKELRLKAGVTRHHVALELGINNKNLKRLEECVSFPTVRTALILAEYFNSKELKELFYIEYIKKSSDRKNENRKTNPYGFDPTITIECLGCKNQQGKYCSVTRDPSRWSKKTGRKCYLPMY